LRACFPERGWREWALREHLQRLVLYALAWLNLYERYTLQGGTALRFAHGSPRLSLNLDFALEGAVAESLRHAEILRGLLERALAPEGVSVGLSGLSSTRQEAFTGTSLSSTHGAWSAGSCE
jgi:predicted nucleotidyltransferase component of viral defense system